MRPIINGQIGINFNKFTGCIFLNASRLLLTVDCFDLKDFSITMIFC